MFTFAGLAFVYNPMKLGLRGIYMPSSTPAAGWKWWTPSGRSPCSWCRPWPSCCSTTPPSTTPTSPSIQICAIGSAPLAPFVVEALQDKMPEAMVDNNYGMTEAGSATASCPKGEAPAPAGLGGPAGRRRPRCGSSTARATGSRRARSARSGCKIPGRTREYFGDPEATAETWVDGWLVTGDLGKVDEDGYLYIVGRSKDVIIRGGNNIHATDVEHVILSHPDVVEAAVVGVPHPVLGEDVVGFVVLRPGVPPDLDGLRAFCLTQLADYKVPRQWHVVDELPRNATGKVVKPELRRRLEEAPSTGGP